MLTSITGNWLCKNISTLWTKQIIVLILCMYYGVLCTLIANQGTVMHYGSDGLPPVRIDDGELWGIMGEMCRDGWTWAGMEKAIFWHKLGWENLYFYDIDLNKLTVDRWLQHSRLPKPCQVNFKVRFKKLRRVNLSILKNFHHLPLQLPLAFTL
jgi:hypothetical protein